MLVYIFQEIGIKYQKSLDKKNKKIYNYTIINKNKEKEEYI